MGRALDAALIGALAMLTAATGSAAHGQAANGLTPSQQAIDGYWRRDRRPVMAGTALDAAAAIPTDPDTPPLGPGGLPNIILGAALPHLQPWARAYRDRYLAAEEAGRQLRTPGNLCLPYAIPGTGVPGGPAYIMGILLEPRQATFLYQENRQIRFAAIGAEHPATLQASWLGHSVAHWEGDTLVVDTVGFNDMNLLGDTVPVTHALHVVQRLRVVDDKLEDRATFDDPGAFTEPFVAVHTFERAEPFQEYVCAENNNEGGAPTANGAPTPYRLPGAPVAATGLDRR